VGNPFDPHWGILMTLTRKNWGILLAPDKRVLRAEVVVHNAKELKFKRSVSNFEEIVKKLRIIMTNFMDNLCYTHVSLLSDGSLEQLTNPTQKGKQRLAGVDIKKKRNIAVMKCVLALAIKPGGYSAKDISILMKEKLDKKQSSTYTPAKAAYDIRKFRGKALVDKTGNTRKDKTTKKGIETIVGILSITQKILPTILSSVNKTVLSGNPEEMSELDNHYIKINSEINAICKSYGIKAAA
jgi:hypothetical protein